MSSRILILAFLLGSVAPAAAQDYSRFDDAIHEIDMGRAWNLLNRQREGEALSAEEAAFLEKAMSYRRAWQALERKRRAGETLSIPEADFLDKALAALRRARQRARARYREEHPPQDSTGLVPLTDLTGAYEGFEGGLYPGGSNTPPEAHLEEGLRRAKAIAPLDAAGEPSASGTVVLVSIGMSNTTQEFQAFLKLAAEAPGLHPNLVIVDGAQGGQAANTTANPDAPFWSRVNDRLRQKDVTPEQVQVAWIKQAVPQPGRNGESVQESVERLKGYMKETVRNLKRFYPNVQIAYVSSRIYAGYAEGALNPEPYAHAGGFAMKALVADQIAGDPALNYDAEKGEVVAPWLAWGPYLWADGLKPRSDGLTYLRSDLAADGIHPSPSGRVKVGRQLLTFFTTDPTARPWFLE